MSEILDARRLLCPMPVIRVQNALNKLAVGDRLTVFCTDPGTLHDIPTWCRINHHKLISVEQQENQQVFILEKCDF